MTQDIWYIDAVEYAVGDAEDVVDIAIIVRQLKLQGACGCLLFLRKQRGTQECPYAAAPRSCRASCIRAIFLQGVLMLLTMSIPPCKESSSCVACNTTQGQLHLESLEAHASRKYCKLSSAPCNLSWHMMSATFTSSSATTCIL